jgi:hypothetical protein
LRQPVDGQRRDHRHYGREPGASAPTQAKEEAMMPDTVAAYIKFLEDTITSLEEKRRRQGDEKAKLERKLGARSRAPRPAPPPP